MAPARPRCSRKQAARARACSVPIACLLTPPRRPSCAQPYAKSFIPETATLGMTANGRRRVLLSGAGGSKIVLPTSPSPTADFFAATDVPGSPTTFVVSAQVRACACARAWRVMRTTRGGHVRMRA